MKRLTLFFVLSLLHVLAYAALPTAVSDALKHAGIPQENVAVYVQAVDANMPVLSLNADKPMNPASVMKLVTTYAALEKLTPAYRWKTEVYRDGEVKQGVLYGDLVIKGYGDPDFQPHHFWQLLMQLQQLGIRKVTGDLVIDKTYFTPQANNIAFDDEIWRAYNAPPSAFLVNGRKTSLQFQVLDNQVYVHQEFPLPQVNVEQHLTLRAGECGDWRSNIDYKVVPEKSRVNVYITGSYAASCESRYLELSLFNDEEYALYTFKTLWKELGGAFGGKLNIRPTPERAVKMLEHWSAPLGEQVQDINKWSNNLMARQLLLTLAAVDDATLATEQHGAEVIKQQMVKLNMPMGALVVENGSGLSRLERVSAGQLGGMLVRAFHRPVMPELMASLPILGLDGTVKTRMQASDVQAKAHLKTGSINGVSAIAGYILGQDQRRYVMVMLVNDAKSAQARAAQDALITWVYQH
jgi:D-alanyl-D-alanine carboxypeptidase/D-alanyl-D-alanine-endopeptidase (penicillin-binding protein 4)